MGILGSTVNVRTPEEAMDTHVIDCTIRGSLNTHSVPSFYTKHDILPPSMSAREDEYRQTRISLSLIVYLRSMDREVTINDPFLFPEIRHICIDYLDFQKKVYNLKVPGTRAYRDSVKFFLKEVETHMNKYKNFFPSFDIIPNLEKIKNIFVGD
ncbi:MAG: hypothetical protein GY804_09350 [Alphaproteobacteria bacterium]|nr:hypothetical protein [Alphaproteobacteria bacterium]